MSVLVGEGGVVVVVVVVASLLEERERLGLELEMVVDVLGDRITGVRVEVAGFVFKLEAEGRGKACFAVDESVGFIALDEDRVRVRVAVALVVAVVAFPFGFTLTLLEVAAAAAVPGFSSSAVLFFFFLSGDVDPSLLDAALLLRGRFPLPNMASHVSSFAPSTLIFATELATLTLP